MEQLVQIRSAAEAKKAEREYYHSLTPAQRIEILLMLTKLHYGDEYNRKFVTVLEITDK
jgi:hypothetical protein